MMITWIQLQVEKHKMPNLKKQHPIRIITVKLIVPGVSYIIKAMWLYEIKPDMHDIHCWAFAEAFLCFLLLKNFYVSSADTDLI